MGRPRKNPLPDAVMPDLNGLDDAEDVGETGFSASRNLPEESGEPVRGKEGRRARKARPATVDISGLERMLYSVHIMGATILAAPELRLDESEARGLADAIGQVAAHYGGIPDSKYMAWGNLAVLAGAIYGPRIVVMRNRMRKAADDHGVQAS